MRIAKIKWAMPHCYALIFFIIILVALLTWCIPSGSFDYHSVTLPGGETKTLVIPGSYHLLDKVSSEGDLRQGIAAVLAAPMEGDYQGRRRSGVCAHCWWRFWHYFTYWRN